MSIKHSHETVFPIDDGCVMQSTMTVFCPTCGNDAPEGRLTRVLEDLMCDLCVAKYCCGGQETSDAGGCLGSKIFRVAATMGRFRDI